MKILILISISTLLFLVYFLLSKKEQANKQVEEETEENWDFYLTKVNDKLASIALDLGIKNIAPIKDKPILTWVFIKMNKPREDGLSSNEEMEVLGNIEDDLTSTYKYKFNSVYAGRITSDNEREFYFYQSDSTDIYETTKKVMSKYNNYKYESGFQKDEKWSQYLELLYPLPEQLQNIQNRHVIESLEKSGDKLTKEREVFHWIYFKAKDDRAKYIKIVTEKGFQIENQDNQKTTGDFPFKLNIKRIDMVDYSSINEYTIYLWKLANELNGEYDGWETSVEK